MPSDNDKSVLTTQQSSEIAFIRTGDSDGPADLSEADKAAVIEGLHGGLSLATILRIRPSISGSIAVYRARRNDPAFDKAYTDAKNAGIAVRIDESVDYAMSVRADAKKAVGAAQYARAVLMSAEKLAPKEFGPLVKVAGHDGNALSISVISFKDAGAVVLDAEAVEVTPITDQSKVAD